MSKLTPSLDRKVLGEAIYRLCHGLTNVTGVLSPDAMRASIESHLKGFAPSGMYFKDGHSLNIASTRAAYLMKLTPALESIEDSDEQFDAFMKTEDPVFISFVNQVVDGAIEKVSMAVNRIRGPLRDKTVTVSEEINAAISGAIESFQGINIKPATVFSWGALSDQTFRAEIIREGSEINRRFMSGTDAVPVSAIGTFLSAARAAAAENKTRIDAGVVESIAGLFSDKDASEVESVRKTLEFVVSSRNQIARISDVIDPRDSSGRTGLVPAVSELSSHLDAILKIDAAIEKNQDSVFPTKEIASQFTERLAHTKKVAFRLFAAIEMFRRTVGQTFFVMPISRSVSHFRNFYVNADTYHDYGNRLLENGNAPEEGLVDAAKAAHHHTSVRGADLTSGIAVRTVFDSRDAISRELEGLDKTESLIWDRRCKGIISGALQEGIKKSIGVKNPAALQQMCNAKAKDIYEKNTTVESVVGGVLAGDDSTPYVSSFYEKSRSYIDKVAASEDFSSIDPKAVRAEAIIFSVARVVFETVVQKKHLFLEDQAEYYVR